MKSYNRKKVAVSLILINNTHPTPTYRLNFLCFALGCIVTTYPDHDRQHPLTKTSSKFQIKIYSDTLRWQQSITRSWKEVAFICKMMAFHPIKFCTHTIYNEQECKLNHDNTQNVVF